MHHAVRYQTGHRPAASLHRFRHCKLRTDLLWTRNGQMACIFRPRSVESAVRDHAVIQSGVEHTITWSWVRRPNDYNGCRNWPQIFSACHISTHVDDCALRLNQRWSLQARCVLPLATAPFQLLLHRSATVCRSQSGHHRRCKFSTADWKPNFLPGLTDMTKNVSLRWLLLRDFTV